MYKIDESEIVAPPWKLRASALIFLDRVLDERGKTRFGARAFVCYAQSPVGAYNEMATAILTIRGPRVTQMPVTLRASMLSGRANWGFPKTLETIEWTRGKTRETGNRVLVRARGKSWRARIPQFSFPLKLSGWTIQTLREHETNEREVRVPVQIVGRAHLAFSGRRLGIFLDDFVMTVLAPEELR